MKGLTARWASLVGVSALAIATQPARAAEPLQAAAPADTAGSADAPVAEQQRTNVPQAAQLPSRTGQISVGSPQGMVGDDTVGDIIITAQKRSESIQDVPIAITAISGDTLTRSGITGTDALQKVAPGLTVAAIGSGFVSYTYIRGGGTNQLDIGADPSVAYFIDEIYIGGTAGLQFDLFDIDHIEVLKGPQGTLFGRNAASGAISIVTKRPSSVAEGYASLEAGNYGIAVARAGLTGPLVGDSLLYRLAVGYKHNDAFVKNLAEGDDPGELSSLSGRAQLEWRGDGVALLLTADGLRARNGQTGWFLSTASKTSVLTPAANALFPMPGESFYRHYYRPGFERQDLWSVSGRLEWSTPIGELTAISAYRDNGFERSQDYTPGVDALRLVTDSRDRTFSQEVRMVSDADQRLRWVAGLFYYHADQTMEYQQVAGSTFVVAPVRNTIRTDDHRLTTKSYAAFGQLSFDIVDDLTLIAGLRYTRDEKRSRRELSTVPPTPTSNFSVDAKKKWDAFTPAVTLQYDINPDVMIYGSYRRGFKSGGFQPAPVATPAIGGTPFDPENVDAYEIGLKSALLDRTVTLNVNLFLSKIRDQQVLQTLPGAINLVSNAGETTAKGFDVSIKARPIRALRLTGDFTYQEARYDRYETLVAGVLNDFAGNTQFRSPDVSLALSAEYDVDLGSAGRLTPAVQYSYRSKLFFTAANLETPGLFQPGYDLADARVTYTPARGDWDLAAWVKNIGDTRYFRNIVVIGTTGIGGPGDPTTFGGTLNVRF
jgi:iron complex outermembrane receptor protein